jgi:hypothetical protein
MPLPPPSTSHPSYVFDSEGQVVTSFEGSISSSHGTEPAEVLTFTTFEYESWYLSLSCDT